MEVSNLLMHAFRGSDVVARLGGDEFGVLLSGTCGKALEFPLRRFAERIAERNEMPGSCFSIEYSAGVVTDSMSSPTSMTALLAEADRCMYEQKQKHRATQAPAEMVE